MHVSCVIFAGLYSHFFIVVSVLSRFTNIFLRFHESMLHFPIDKNLEMLYNNTRKQRKESTAGKEVR